MRRPLPRSLREILNNLDTLEAPNLLPPALLTAWREIVGSFVATHATPQRIDQRTLHIHCPDPIVRAELDLRRKELAEQLRARGFALTDLHLSGRS